MAFGAILGGLLGAGGQVAGGLLGGASGGQGRTVNYNPALDYALQATQYAGLDPLGFGNLANIPGPYQQAIARLQGTPMHDKTREAAIKAMAVLRNNPEYLSDPGGNNFSAEQIQQFLRDPSSIPAGRTMSADFSDGLIEKIMKGGGSGLGAVELANKIGSPFPVIGLPSLKKSLRAQGLGVQDLQAVLEQEAKFAEQMQVLKDAGLDGLNTDSIINRANAAATANSLLGGAASFAQTGQPGNQMSQDLLNRDEQQLKNLRERLGLMANFGGINPSSLFDSLTDAKLDQNIRLVEQQLGMSNALQASLNPATAAAANIAGQGSQTSMNSAQIAAQQAQAAASLRTQQVANSSSSFANGLAGGLGSLGSAISNQSYLSQMPKSPYSAGYTTNIGPFASGYQFGQ